MTFYYYIKDNNGDCALYNEHKNMVLPFGEYDMYYYDSYYSMDFDGDFEQSQFDYSFTNEVVSLYLVDKSGKIGVFNTADNAVKHLNITVNDSDSIGFYENFIIVSKGAEDSYNFCTCDVYNSSGKLLYKDSLSGKVTYDRKYIWIVDDKYMSYMNSDGQWMYREDTVIETEFFYRYQEKG